MLAIINMLGEHYGEGYAEVIRWPWRVFCARWAAVYRKARTERMKREQEREDREHEADLRRMRGW